MANKLDFYIKGNFRHLVSRLDALQHGAVPRWGKMNTGQMLQHLNRAIGSGLGFYDFKDESNFFTRGPVKFLIFNVIKSFPKSSKTPQPLKVTDQFAFESERDELKKILHKAYCATTDTDWKHHPYFGKLNRKEWGRLIALHCDHHFKQFGV